MFSSHALLLSLETSTVFQFSMWSQDVVVTSIGLASDLKLGQYLKVWAVYLEMLARGVHDVMERFPLVPCF